MMKKVLELIEDMTTEKSVKFIDNLNILKENIVDETRADYNPKTARCKSMKDITLFSEN